MLNFPSDTGKLKEKDLINHYTNFSQGDFKLELYERGFQEIENLMKYEKPFRLIPFDASGFNSNYLNDQKNFQILLHEIQTWNETI
jgi:hypothetical protein